MVVVAVESRHCSLKAEFIEVVGHVNGVAHLVHGEIVPLAAVLMRVPATALFALPMMYTVTRPPVPWPWVT